MSRLGQLCSFIVIALVAACGPHKKPKPPAPPKLEISATTKPAEVRSFGATDVYYQLTGVPRQGARIAIPLAVKQRFMLTEESLRLAWFNPQLKRYEILDDSRFEPDLGKVSGVAMHNGVYTVIGRPSVPHIGRFVDRLCGQVRGLAENGIGRLPPICPVILCPALDVGAWSRAFEERGLPIGSEMVEIGFSNVCDECTRGGFGRVDFPECWIGGGPGGGSGTPVTPPELEQMPLDIGPGGRAVSVAVHPEDDSQMVVASETGGLFRTRDRGNEWDHVSQAHSFRFTDVLYYPPNPSVVVASAEQHSALVSRGGVWRSEDGGASWSKASVSTPTPACLETLSAYDLAFEADANRLWAGTSCGIAFSNDAGLTWQYPPTAPQQRADSILVPGGNRIMYLQNNVVQVSPDGGATWSNSTTGLPGNRARGVHNAIALSPLNPQHVFYAFYNWVYDAAADKWNPFRNVYLSTDGAVTWQQLEQQAGVNRPVFLRTTAATDSQYTLYYGNGGGMKRSTVTDGTPPSLAAWENLALNHADPSDVGFANGGTTPLLLTSDGGLGVTSDGGANWVYAGDQGRGYNALQITEVTGQLRPGSAPPHLYFGTQDNDIWASPDEGVNWPNRRCCEGFFLEVRRDISGGGENKVTGVSCAGCGNFISDPLLVNQAPWPNPPNEGGNPKLLAPRKYVQNSPPPGLNTMYSLTEDTGGSWVPRYGFAEYVQAFPHSAGPETDPTVFVAFKDAGSTPDGAALLGIKKTINVLGSSTPVISNVPGVGALGTFPTMFAWYKPFAVDPNEPDRLLVPDILADQVKITQDAGGAWTNLTSLTQMVTENGDLKFHWGQFGQVSNAAFDPGCDGHILVGTAQAGIFQSKDGGTNWRKVPGSERVPFVSRFFFDDDGEVILSSYGRGLWRLRYTCDTGPGRLIVPPRFPIPFFWRPGVLTPFDSIELPPNCPKCELLIPKGGEITGLQFDPKSRALRSVRVSSGTLVPSLRGGEFKPAFKITTDDQTPLDQELARLLAAGNRIAAIFVEDGTLQGVVVVGSPGTQPPKLPQRKLTAPYISVNLPGAYGTPAEDLQKIVVTGQNFQRNVPLRVSVDGQALPVPAPKFDRTGTFTLVLPPNFEIGGHTLRIEQTVRGKTLFDVVSFNLTTKDVPQRPPQRQPPQQQPRTP